MLRCSRHALINQQGEIKMEAGWTFSGTLLNLISLSVPMVIFLRESRIMNSSKILTLNLSDKTLSRDPSRCTVKTAIERKSVSEIAFYHPRRVVRVSRGQYYVWSLIGMSMEFEPSGQASSDKSGQIDERCICNLSSACIRRDRGQ